MKLSAVSLLLLVVISSCKKSTSDNNEPVSTVAVSVHIPEPDFHTLRLDSFVRDDNKRLSKYIYIGIDSTVTPAKTYTFEYDFSYTGNDSLPTSYTAAYSTDYHKLQYDSQRRIIMDSSMQIHNTFYFSYTPSGTILYQDLPSNVGHYIDTMKVSNGNIASRSYWYFGPTFTQHTNFTYTYSSVANPLSFSATSVGLLLLEISGRRDYLSKNLFSLNQVANDFPETYNATWATDKYGRVVNGQQTHSTSGKVYESYITYMY